MRQDYDHPPSSRGTSSEGFFHTAPSSPQPMKSTTKPTAESQDRRVIPQHSRTSGLAPSEEHSKRNRHSAPATLSAQVPAYYPNSIMLPHSHSRNSSITTPIERALRSTHSTPIRPTIPFITVTPNHSRNPSWAAPSDQSNVPPHFYGSIPTTLMQGHCRSSSLAISGRLSFRSSHHSSRSFDGLPNFKQHDYDPFLSRRPAPSGQLNKDIAPAPIQAASTAKLADLPLTPKTPFRLPPSPTDTSKEVLLKVGPQEAPFYVSRELICWHSAYFRAGFRGLFKEADEGIMKLPDTDPYAFNGVTYWMQTGTFPSAPIVFPARTSASPSPTGRQAHFRLDLLSAAQARHQMRQRHNITDMRDTLLHAWAPHMQEDLEAIAALHDPEPDWYSSALANWLDYALDVYIFADKYDMPALRTAILTRLQAYDYLKDTYGRIIEMHAVKKAFANLPVTSPLCQYLISRFGNDWWPQNKEVLGELPKEFLVEISLIAFEALAKLRGLSTDAGKHEVWCQFHEHETTEERTACQLKRMEERMGMLGEGRKKKSKLP